MYHLQKGWRLEFVEDVDRSGLSTAAKRALIVLGVAGFTARSLMLFIAGALFVLAAWQHNGDDQPGSMSRFGPLPLPRVGGCCSVGPRLVSSLPVSTTP